MKNLTALLASTFPRPLWSDMASPPGSGGGLYRLQLLDFVIMMLNGLLGIAIAKVLEVAACLFWSDSNAPEGDFHTSLSFLLIFGLCSLFLMYVPSHVLKTNFWVKVTPCLAWGPHLGFHLAVPLMVIHSEGAGHFRQESPTQEVMALTQDLSSNLSQVKKL